MSTIVAILCSSITAAGAIIYASIGEILVELSGVSNLGLEGVMLLGAVTGYIVAVETKSLLLAILAVLLVGAVIGLFYAICTVSFRANQIVCGLALVTLGNGMSGFFGKKYAGIVSGLSFQKIPIPGLSDIPVLGPVLFEQDALIYGIYILVPLMMIYIYKTKAGLKLRALGENPATIDIAGGHVRLMRYAYTIIGTAIVAVGGAYVTLAYTPSWYDQITAGAGWIAAALVIFSQWNPLKAFLGALLFRLVSAIGVKMQLSGIEISSFFISMLPYLCTVIVLILSTGRFGKAQKSKAPAMLGKAYDPESR